MKRFSLALVATLFALPLAAQNAASAGPSTDRDAVLATIERFTQGLRTKDTTLMAAQIDSLTRMTLLRPVPGGGSRVFLLSGREFLRVATQPNQPPLDEPIRNPVVQIDGDLASVWAEYQVRRDGKVTHCGYDAFHLARLNGTWKILNVSDTYRTTGCGEAWPTK